MADVRGAQKRRDSDYERPIVAELCRMTWLAFGPAGIIFVGATVWKQPPWTYSIFDGVFWGIAALVVIARFLDVRFFRGRTTDDQPATMRHWWLYSAKFLLFATVVWLLAQRAQA
jgi:hypothetical protein